MSVAGAGRGLLSEGTGAVSLPCVPTVLPNLWPVRTHSYETTDALPESSTCSSTLFLPHYARWVCWPPGSLQSGEQGRGVTLGWRRMASHEEH